MLNTQISSDGSVLTYKYMQYTQNGTLIGEQHIDFEITLSNVNIQNGTIIDYISNGAVTYKCSNGVAVLVQDGGYKVRLLTEGTYLDLYD